MCLKSAHYTFRSNPIQGPQCPYAQCEKNAFISANKCNQGRWFKVITREDGNKGLNCREFASLNNETSPTIIIVPKTHYVQVKSFVKNPIDGGFFNVSYNGNDCYMRATRSRLSYWREYTDTFFEQQDCDSKSCSFKVITHEDKGGLNCRTKPSLKNSSVKVIVPKNYYVNAIGFAKSEKEESFFKISYNGSICYIRATQSRLYYAE